LMQNASCDWHSLTSLSLLIDRGGDSQNFLQKFLRWALKSLDYHV